MPGAATGFQRFDYFGFPRCHRVIARRTGHSREKHAKGHRLFFRMKQNVRKNTFFRLNVRAF